MSQLPWCPKCYSLLRPAIVLFYEKLYKTTSDTIDEWLDRGVVDLLLVIGTSSLVSPAADYIDRAVELGSRVAVVNISPPEKAYNDSKFGSDHWYFQGDAADILPEILKEVVGNV